MVFRKVKPSWRCYVEFVDFAARNGNEGMIRYRDCYNALSPRDRQHHWPEQICDLANVTPGELIGAVCRAIWESKAAESSIIAAIMHPRVLESISKFALDPDHYADRELYMRSTGSLPDRKGVSVNIVNSPGMPAASLTFDGPAAKLPTMDEDVIEMSRHLDGAAFVVKKDVPPEDR